MCAHHRQSKIESVTKSQVDDHNSGFTQICTNLMHLECCVHHTVVRKLGKQL